MAGHSKWSNIKHRKARQDARRSKVWSKCARALIVAAKNGGSDPAMNLTLRYAVDEAKAANMPRDTIENAIKKGAGELGAQTYEEIRYEGYGPNGVAVMLDILTDNRNRTAGEIRKLFEKAGGNLGQSGCVAYVFQARGQIYIEKSAADEETVMALALEAGADDVADEDGGWLIITQPTAYPTVRQAVEEAGLPVETAELTMAPTNSVACVGRDAEKVWRLIENLDDHDDVQKVYANFDIPDDELAALQG